MFNLYHIPVSYPGVIYRCAAVARQVSAGYGQVSS